MMATQKSNPQARLFSIFLAIKLIGAMHRKQAETPAAPAPKPDDVVLLEQIRDILQKQTETK